MAWAACPITTERYNRRGGTRKKARLDAGLLHLLKPPRVSSGLVSDGGHRLQRDRSTKAAGTATEATKGATARTTKAAARVHKVAATTKGTAAKRAKNEVSSLAQERIISVNRAPVLTLWAAVVAERLGFDRDTALTLGRAVAGLNAYSKGVSLGLLEPSSKKVDEHLKKVGQVLSVDLLHRAVPVVRTPDGLRALSKDRPISSASVKRYLEGKFGENLDRVRRAMEKLARSLPPDEIAGRAYHLYEGFRPEIPAGVRGWGAAGELDLGRIQALAPP